MVEGHGKEKRAGRLHETDGCRITAAGRSLRQKLHQVLLFRMNLHEPGFVQIHASRFEVCVSGAQIYVTLSCQFAQTPNLCCSYLSRERLCRSSRSTK